MCNFFMRYLSDKIFYQDEKPKYANFNVILTFSGMERTIREDQSSRQSAGLVPRLGLGRVDSVRV